MIVVDRMMPKALHRQIYDAYRQAVIDGLLRPGQRVPSSRELASELKVSRFPVINAYAQLLAEGYFESEVGSGTRVSNTLPDRYPAAQPGAKQYTAGSGPRVTAKRTAALPRYERPPWLRGRGAFTVGQVAADEFPNQIWRTLVTRQSGISDPRSLDYGNPMGSARLRESLALYLRTARSVRCTPEQILIVSGSQQALDIASRVLLDPGDPVWVEEPGYAFARNALALSGCRLVPVPVDKEGMNISAGIEQCRKARAVVVTPSHQFPLGVTMSASRRLQLLEWAAKTGAWIIEDDFDSEFRYGSSPISSLHGLDSDARVIYIGTFSKVLFPSLRLGYIVMPPDLMERFLVIRRGMDLGPPSFYQEVISSFIEEGHFARHLRRMRSIYHERRSALVASIRHEFGSSAVVLGDEAGLQLVLASRPGTRDVEIALRAAEQDLWVWPLSTSYLGHAARPGFILGFGNVAVEEIPPAVRKLRKLHSQQELGR